MYTEEQVIKALEAKAPHDEVAREALKIIEQKERFFKALMEIFRDMREKRRKYSLKLERYGRRIREQKEEILDLRAKLDGAIAGQETLQKALSERSKNEDY